MAGDDELDVWIQIGGDVGDVVDKEGVPAVDSAGQKVGEVFGPWAAEIIVAAHGVDGRNFGQLGEDVRVADVAGVDDQVTALERANGFGAEKIVSVGYQCGFQGPILRGCFEWEWLFSTQSCHSPSSDSGVLVRHYGY